MARYLAALERLMADVVTYGDLLLPPRRPGEVARVRDALSTARTAASTVRELLRAAVGDTATTRIAAEEPLLDYTFAALSAVEHVLTDRLAGRPAAQAADRATAALAQARTHVATVAPEITGTWGAYDLELTHHFYAAALR